MATQMRRPEVRMSRLIIDPTISSQPPRVQRGRKAHPWDCSDAACNAAGTRCRSTAALHGGSQGKIRSRGVALDAPGDLFLEGPLGDPSSFIWRGKSRKPPGNSGPPLCHHQAAGCCTSKGLDPRRPQLGVPVVRADKADSHKLRGQANQALCLCRLGRGPLCLGEG